MNRRFFALILTLLLCAVTLVLPVAATVTTSEHNGLEITIEMDKEVYEADEPITATITVRNITQNEITIANLEQLIPQGYRLAEGSDISKEDTTLRPGRKVALTVTMDSEYEPEAEGEDQGTWLDKLLYGKTSGVSNLVWALILVGLVALFFYLT